MGILKTKIPMLGPSAIYLTVEDLSGSGDALGKLALAAGGARARSIEGGDQRYGSCGYENFVELERAKFPCTMGVAYAFCMLRYLETWNDRSWRDGREMGWTSSGEP